MLGVWAVARALIIRVVLPGTDGSLDSVAGALAGEWLAEAGTLSPRLLSRRGKLLGGKFDGSF
jgi:hypothetical protein